MNIERFKFLADMGVSPRCVEWLRSQGHDAIHLYEQGLHKISDSEVLRKASNEKRILLTMDLDFARLISKAESDSLPIVIIFRMSDQRPQHVQARLEIIINMLLKAMTHGSSIISVSDNNIRIRNLPIK